MIMGSEIIRRKSIQGVFFKLDGKGVGPVRCDLQVTRNKVLPIVRYQVESL